MKNLQTGVMFKSKTQWNVFLRFEKHIRTLLHVKQFFVVKNNDAA